MTLVRRVALVVVPLALGIATPAQGMTCSTGSAVSNPSANPGLVADCTVLLNAKQAWGGPQDWRTDRPMEDWDGVTLGGSPRRVTILDLGFKRLSGSIPADLGNLSKLTQLDLYANDLSGRSLSNFSNLLQLIPVDKRTLGRHRMRPVGLVCHWRYSKSAFEDVTRSCMKLPRSRC